MKIKKELIIGFLMLIAIGLGVYGFYFLKGQNFFQEQKIYYAVYEDVAGLTDNAPVQINGLPVGQVDKVDFTPDNSGKLYVAFNITHPNIKIPKGSIARIVSLDLMGTKAVSIEFAKTSGAYHQPGDTLLSAVQNSLQEEVNAQVLPLKEKAEELIASMDSAVTIVQMVLNKNARENLSKSFESIKRGIETFETTSLRLDTMIASEKQRIAHIFSNLESITHNIRRNNDNLDKIINNFATISDTLAKAHIAQAITNASIALTQVSSIIEKINNGEGSLGMLINNDSLYINLEQASLEMDKLLEDIRVNPQRYRVFTLFPYKEKAKDKHKQKKRPK